MSEYKDRINGSWRVTLPKGPARPEAARIAPPRSTQAKGGSASERDAATPCRTLADAPTREAVLSLLALSEAETRETLFPAADACRRNNVGDAIHLRGIIEFSNYCRQDCLYCGLRRSNTRLDRYRMAEDEILAATIRIAGKGIGTVVLQSGEDGYYTSDRLCRLVARIKAKTGLAVTLSVGERPRAEYLAFREAGADRYLLKYETTDPFLYRRLRPGLRLADRIRALENLRDLGYEVGTGNMIGLPGQTLETLADDLWHLRARDADMLGIGPFLPHPQTPLADEPPGDLFLTLKAVAVARLLTRDTNIPATTALNTLGPGTRVSALRAGANIVMPDFTPPSYRRLYEIYPGRNRDLAVEDFLQRLTEEFSGLGRFVGTGNGQRKR
jgi:biotin synthase